MMIINIATNHNHKSCFITVSPKEKKSQNEEKWSLFRLTEMTLCTSI